MKRLLWCALFSLLTLPIFIAGITTTHYDKAPDLTQQHSSSIKPINQRQPANLTLAERQKRLLPYINFYVSDNTKTTGDDVFYATPQKINSYQQVDASKFGELLSSPYDQNKVYDPQVSYEPKIKYTPFLESNALPGPFVPMIRQQPHKIKIYHNPLEQRDKVPNYSAIYDKLSQLKLQQNAAHNYYKNLQNNGPRYYLNRKPQVNYIPLRDYQEQIQPPKMYVHSYTPTSIEVPSSEDNSYETQTYNGPERIPIKFAHHTIKPHPYRVIQLSNSKDVHEQLLTNETPLKLTTTNNYVPTLAEYIIQQPKPYHTQNHKQFLQEVIPNRKPFLLVSQKPTTNEQFKVTKPIIVLPPPKSYTSEPIVSPNYQTISAIQVPTPPTTGREEDSNSLGQLLKKLQDSNTLPHTLTPDNIDNSIKTLVQILNSLKKHQKITRPIVVAEESDEYQDEDEGDKGDESSLEDSDDGSVTHNFPANTPEGGTPGKPGIDYPALSSIPQTNFNCKTQRYKGFFADPDTNCQVWHYCDLNGGQASFLCPNGTIFSQVALTCDWWFNVKCSTTTQLYVLNERLYKYIIPLTPKFPEDYSGPLVDKYLAIKFKEMEDKLKKEKEEQKSSDDDKNDEVDELQVLEDKKTESTSHTTTSNPKDT